MDLRVAQAQINSTVGDLKGNVAKIGFAISRAKDARADIVTFPELAVCGYPPEDLLMRPLFLQQNIEALDEVVRLSEGIATVVGFVDMKANKIYNAAAVINNAQLAGVYHKIKLPNYGVFDEKRYFHAGSTGLVFRINGAILTVTICEDIWIAGAAPERCAMSHGAHIVLNISASPFHAGKLAQRRKVVTGFAKRTKACLCYNNIVGGQDELVFDGGSVVVNPRGEIIASAKRFEEDLLITDINVDTPEKKSSPRIKKSNNSKIIALESVGAHGMRPDENTDVGARRAPLQNTLAPELSELEEVYEALVLGARDYIYKNGFNKAVLGLSGGIDSSLVACLAVAALGRENVIGVTMPSRYTSSETRSDAELLAENLKIRLITVPLNEIYTKYLEALEKPFGSGAPGIEVENLQARIRGNILMALSNRFGWIVLTTGNKSETATGYCTIYGDTAGGFAPIKDVPKTMVYRLSEHVNKKAGRAIIPKSVIIRPPTAELRPNQKDEDSLPPYALLDPILHEYVEEDRSLNEIVAKGFNPEVIKDVIRMVDRAEFKRRQAPPGVKITPKAFGRDRRMPITNRFRS